MNAKEKKALQIAEQITPLAFIFNRGIRNENGSPIEFRDHYFLIDPYNDMSERQAVRKASQVGWSVLAINKALWLAKFKKANIIYTLPSKSIVKDFVIPKVNPIISQNPIYQEWLSETNSISLKKVGNRFIYFRGSWEEEAAISISAHILINDEVDRSNAGVLRTYRTRLDDAKRERPELGYIWQFSNPSVPSAGVDNGWLESDQKHWFVKCRKCTHEWYLQWPNNIDVERELYICEKCHNELTREDRRKGRWVVKNKGAKTSGYWISQLMVPWIPASKIIEDSQGDQQTFHNFTLGLPYIAEDQSVSRETLVKCISPDTNDKRNVAIGVDNGIVKTVVIGNSHGIFKIYETESWERIEEDIKLYQAHCVIDANPYPNTPRKLSQAHKGKVFLHWFVEDQKNAGIVRWGEEDKRNTVISDRTKIIDLLVQEFINNEITFNLRLDQLEQYITDWTQLYREIEENKKGILKPVWKSIEGRRDHFAFATIYWRIALEKTFSSGAVIRNLPKKDQDEQPIISPDMTISAPDTKEIMERIMRGKRDWRTA